MYEVDEQAFQTVETFDELIKLPNSRLTVSSDAMLNLPETEVYGDFHSEFAKTGTPVYVKGINLISVQDVFYYPALGIIIQRDGGVLPTPYSSASFKLGSNYNEIPNVTDVNGELNFVPPSEAPRLDLCAVFMPWGALHNYGHFLLDALTSLWEIRNASQGSLRAVSSPLTKWQKRHIELIGMSEMVDEIDGSEEIVHIEKAIYASSMDHWLSLIHI